jgi:hypothetical protein
MFELAGLVYDLVKDLARYLEWSEEEKLVDFQWPTYSGFATKVAESGRTVFWSRPDQIERRIQEGCELAYEIDKVRRIRRRIVLRDGLVLMSRTNAR